MALFALSCEVLKLHHAALYSALYGVLGSCRVYIALYSAPGGQVMCASRGIVFTGVLIASQERFGLSAQAVSCCLSKFGRDIKNGT